MSIEISPKSFFEQPSVADMRLIACPGAEELTGLIDKHLVRWAKAAGIEKDTFIISCDCPRFQSGDAKGLVKESVRGDDIFIVVDPGNYSVTYKLFNYENHMSPDDHFANLKRLIQAVAGKAHRVSVIMPSLYGGRQHRRVSRESLDCAFSLQQLRAVGVKNIITFDAHDPRVQNAIPLIGFDKEEIIAVSEKIGTFETSSLPYEDCCTVFTPRHPATHPKMEKILEGESKLDIDGLIDEAMAGIEIVFC